MTISESLVKLAEPVLGKPVRVFIWRNGEFEECGQEVSISPKSLRSWNSILVYLTKILEPQFGAVRKLYHIPSKQVVWCFDDLIPGGKYIAAGFEKLKFKPDGYQSVSDKRYSVLHSLKFTTKSESLKAMLDTITYTQKKKRTIIYIMVNGKSCVPPCKIVFIEDDLHDWEIDLQYMGHRLNVPEGIQYLCTVNGEIVFEPHQLQHGDLYIGVPFGQRFKKMDYVKQFHDLVKLQRQKISYYPRPKKLKGKKVLSATYAPWSAKNRKGRRISATIMSPLAITTTDRTSTGRTSSPGRTYSSSASRIKSSSRGNTSRDASSCKKPSCVNKGCQGECTTSKKATQSGRTIVSCGSQTMGHMKNKLGSIINACLDAVENHGFIEPKKNNDFQKARLSIQDEIKKVSAKTVTNDFKESYEMLNVVDDQNGTILTTFAQLAQRYSPQKFEVHNNSLRSEEPGNRSTAGNILQNNGKTSKTSISVKSVGFDDSVESDSSDSELSAVRAFSKKSLTEEQIWELRRMQAQRSQGNLAPRHDSFELYQDKLWRATASHHGLEKIPNVTSKINFAKIYSNEKTVLNENDADVDQLWKKSSAQSTDKSMNASPSNFSSLGTSRTTDNSLENETQRSKTNYSTVKSGSEPALHCCTSSKIQAAIRKIKTNNLDYVSSDEDPFKASERRAKNILNKKNNIFGQLGSVVKRNEYTDLDSCYESIENPPSEGNRSDSKFRNEINIAAHASLTPDVDHEQNTSSKVRVIDLDTENGENSAIKATRSAVASNSDSGRVTNRRENSFSFACSEICLCTNSTNNSEKDQ